MPRMTRIERMLYCVTPTTFGGYNGDPLEYNKVVDFIKNKHGDDADLSSIRFNVATDSCYGDCDHYVQAEYYARETDYDFTFRKTREQARQEQAKAQEEAAKQKDLALIAELKKKYPGEF